MAHCAQHPAVTQNKMQIRKGSCSPLKFLSSFLPTNSPAHHFLHDLTTCIHSAGLESKASTAMHITSWPAPLCPCWMLCSPCSAPSSPQLQRGCFPRQEDHTAIVRPMHDSLMQSTAARDPVWTNKKLTAKPPILYHQHEASLK